MRISPPLVLCASLVATACATPRVRTYATPEAAVADLAECATTDTEADRVLGAGGADLILRDDVAALIGERVEFEDAGADRKFVLLGDGLWELPVPLVNEDGAWRFDVVAGRAEARCRCVGRNELQALATLHALVDAQTEIADAARGAEGLAGATPAYAQRWSSSAGQRDGMYWPTSDGEAESPLGPLFCRSAIAAAPAADPSCSAACHGYCFRILRAQGANASGGARSYVDADGRMTGGFAFVAWPEEYGVTGVMTFEIDRVGIVFQKDLGADTAARAAAIDTFDPDDSFEPVED